MKIVFFGDSITEGCFELYDNHKGSIDIVRDAPSGYPNLVTQRLKNHFPDLEIEMINAGIGGNTSGDGLNRIQSDIIDINPDIAVVCFGLNDVGQRRIDDYKNNMTAIFARLKNAGIKTVFMTPNMINTYVHPMSLSILKKTSQNCAQCQNDGTMDIYMKTACECARENGAEVCDVYFIWKKMNEYGVDTTELLCNYINHPIRAMHKLFADVLEPCLIAKIQEIINNI